MKILSTAFHKDFPAWTLPDWAVDELRARFPEFEIVKVNSADRIMDEIPETDFLLAQFLKDAHVRAARRLKWIHAPMAGLDGVLIPSVVDSPIVVSNSRGVHAIPMAEHTIALMLALARRLPSFITDQQAGVCRRKEHLLGVPTFDELYGKTVGIVGLGAIGREVARRAEAFGMRVVGFQRSLVPQATLDEVLPDLDYVVITAPLTPQTRGMIGREQFERMKTSAFVVNVARGEIIDQAALIEALESGRIAGAGLDVMVPDPLPDGHPLYSVKNLIITPHVSGLSPMLWRRMMDIWVENIHRFLEGRELINEVKDKTRGY